MRLHLVHVVLLMTLIGCAGEADYRRKDVARIDDYMHTKDRYKIIAVDGKPPVRAAGSFETAVPYVFATSGPHTFTATPLGGTQQMVFTATVVAERMYRVVRADDGGLSLVEVQR